ncbi:unnamed protein product [Polarella glacialis]|uniref:Pentatricopeptide repeat-containing protein, chloroplastic n=1 Tax=Polarella glacialis TaxID=89957 RepID=A0A813IJP3_POLGL|nr:unnamed protein product [Polarella glacialis]
MQSSTAAFSAKHLLSEAPRPSSSAVAGRGRLQSKKAASWKEALVTLDLVLGGQEATSLQKLQCCTAAISACGAGHQWAVAFSLLSKLPSWRLAPDVIICSAAVSACASGGQWRNALLLMKDMEAEGLAPNSRTYAAAISACEKAREWPWALLLLADMQGLGLEANVYCFNAAISACEKGGQWLRGLDLIAAMAVARAQPDVVSFSAATSACEKGGNWAWALELHGQLKLHGLQPNVVSFGAALSACSCGSDLPWSSALVLLGEMPLRGVAPNMVSYNSALHACEKAGEAELALQLLIDAKGLGLTPSPVTYGAALRACQRGGFWESALLLWHELKTFTSAKGQTADADLASCTFGITACDANGGPRAQSCWLLQELRRCCRLKLPGPSVLGQARPVAEEVYQVFGSMDVLHERGHLDALTVSSLGRWLLKPAFARLRHLLVSGQGVVGAVFGSSNDGSVAGGVGDSARSKHGVPEASWRLHEPFLERQPTLGGVFTSETLCRLGLLATSTSRQAGAALWPASAQPAARRILSELADPGAELNSRDIVAWLAFAVGIFGARKLLCRGRSVGFGAASFDTSSSENFIGSVKISDSSASMQIEAEKEDSSCTNLAESLLVPVLREHDRSLHAERSALLALTEEIFTNLEGARQETLLGDNAPHGSVRLYAGHTLCISCLAICCQFQGLFPAVRLQVAMDIWGWDLSSEDDRVELSPEVLCPQNHSVHMHRDGGQWQPRAITLRLCSDAGGRGHAFPLSLLRQEPREKLSHGWATPLLERAAEKLGFSLCNAVCLELDDQVDGPFNNKVLESSRRPRLCGDDLVPPKDSGWHCACGRFPFHDHGPAWLDEMPELPEQRSRRPCVFLVHVLPAANDTGDMPNPGRGLQASVRKDSLVVSVASPGSGCDGDKRKCCLGLRPGHRRKEAETEAEAFTTDEAIRHLPGPGSSPGLGPGSSRPPSDSGPPKEKKPSRKTTRRPSPRSLRQQAMALWSQLESAGVYVAPMPEDSLDSHAPSEGHRDRYELERHGHGCGNTKSTKKRRSRETKVLLGRLVVHLEALAANNGLDPSPLRAVVNRRGRSSNHGAGSRCSSRDLSSVASRSSPDREGTRLTGGETGEATETGSQIITSRDTRTDCAFEGLGSYAAGASSSTALCSDGVCGHIASADPSTNSAANALTWLLGGKFSPMETELKAAHVQDLKEDELEERSKAQAEELRKARFAQGQLRGEPPSSNRINWQREVTRMNNAVHRAEQAFNEVKREQEKRSRQKR